MYVSFQSYLLDKYITYSPGRLVVASHQNITVGFVNLESASNGSRVEVNETLTIDIPLGRSKVYGLFNNRKYKKTTDDHGHVHYSSKDKIMVALETKDQQIDYNFLEISQGSSLNGQAVTYNLVQMREIIPRKHYVDGTDPI